MTRITAVRWLLYGVAGASAALLLLRAVLGPFDFILPVHHALNLECALALSTVLLCFTSGTCSDTQLPVSRAVWPWIIVALAASVAYLPMLPMPLVTDDYIHLRQISSGEAPTPLDCLTHSCGGPQFFRPVGFSTYWAEWELWGTQALPRHLFDLALHVLSSLLFVFLLRALGIPAVLEWLGGLLFALNGIFVEAVVWPAARFDTLSLFFSLLAAIAVLRGGNSGLAISMASTAAACLSKESAYVLPVLLALLLGHKIRTRRGQMLVLSNFAVALTIFVWRWVVLRGIGGYVDPTGAPTVLQFNAITLAKTFLWRVWGILWFPINWSRPLEWWLILALAAGVAGSLILARARPDHRRMWLCTAAVAVACLPTHHMLLIGPSLERSRYLTYATPAFLVLLVTACRGLSLRMAVSALALMVTFQAAAAEHNILIWRTVAAARYELAGRVAGLARGTSGVVAIDGLPLTLDGVYWRNGLEDCLDLDFGIPMGRVRVNEHKTPGTSLHLEWDADARALR